MDVCGISEARSCAFESHKSLHCELVYKKDSSYKEIFNTFVNTKNTSQNIFSYPHPNDVLSLNPHTLAKNNLKLGGLVTIQIVNDHIQPSLQEIFTANTRHTYRVHVDSALELDTVATSDVALQPYVGALFLLEVFQFTYEHATSCNVEIQNYTSDVGDEYKEFLKQIIRNQKRNSMVFCGQVFAFCHGVYAKVVKVNNKEATDYPSYYQLSFQTNIIISYGKSNTIEEETRDEEAWDVFWSSGCLTDVCSVIESLIDPTKGTFKSCLLHTSPDSGERHVVWKVAEKHNVNVVEVSPQDVHSIDFEEFGRKLDNLSQRLISNHQRQTILFLPCLEAFYPSNTIIPFTFLLNHHLASMVQTHGSLFIIASSARDTHKHLTCKDSGVFSLVVNIPQPDMHAKLQILSRLLKLNGLEVFKSKIKSYSLSDLHHIALKTRMMCMLEDSQVSAGYLMQVIDHTPPSLVRSVVVEHPGVEYRDIGGREALKGLLQQFIDLSIHKLYLFSQTNLSPPKGVLLFGPPGCSKTMLAKAIASECSLNFIAVQGTSLHGMYVGETEAAIRDVFNKARMAPSVLFFDEVDAFASCRGTDNTAGLQDRVMQQLLTEVDGCSRLNQVFIMAATNRPDLIDKAFMRPGRFDRCIYVPLPDHATREAILRKRLLQAGMKEEVLLKESDMDALANLTKGFSCAEVSNIVDEAWLLVLEKNEFSIKLEDIVKVIKSTRPSVSEQMVRWYEEYDKVFSH